MLNGLFVVSMISTVVELIAERFVKVVPAENWANKDLWNEDMAKGIPIEQRMKNLENGKYKQTAVYSKPHRDSNGKVIIENGQLYYNDISKHDPLQVQKWVEQGKYNLMSEQLKKEEQRIADKYKRLYSY